MHTSHLFAEPSQALTALPTTRDVIQRVAASRRIAIFVRQSTMLQKAEAVGSAEVQWSERRYLVDHGLPPDHPSILAFDARGESGRIRHRRAIFNALLGGIEEGEIGLVVVLKEDRLGRNGLDGARLMDAMQRRGAYFLISGVLYDPREPKDRFVISMLLNVAELQGDELIVGSMMNRRAKAELGRQPIKLPTGLVWADPTDEDFQDAMAKVERAADLDPVALATRGVHILRDGVTRHVFVHPDKDVLKTVELRFRWLFDAGTLRDVIARIEAGADGWPQPGLVPVVKRDLWRPRMDVRWVRPTRARLWRWFVSPGLYGIYRYHAEKLRAYEKRAGLLQMVVQKEGAFPAFRPPADWRVVRGIVRDPAKRWVRRSEYRGARWHAIPRLLCAHERPGGAGPCGRRLGARFRGDGSWYVYDSPSCRRDHGHDLSVSRGIEPVVLRAVLAAFDPVRLAREVERVRLPGPGAASPAAALDARIVETLRLVDAAADEVLRCRADPSAAPEEVDTYLRAQARHAKALAELRSARAAVSTSDEDLRVLHERDVARILDLAASLPGLLDRATRADRAVHRALLAMPDGEERVRLRGRQGRVQALLRHLIEAVHVRRVGDSFFDVVVEFPNGHRVAETAFVGHFKCPQPARLYAWHAVRVAGRPVEEVAAELRAATARAGKGASWTPGRVRAAATFVETCEHATAPHGPCEVADGIAARTGEPEATVRAALLAGGLGVAALHGDVLGVAPTERALQRALPGYARRTVAVREEWPPDDVALVAELKADYGLDWKKVERRAERGSGIVRDAAGRRYARRSLVGRTDAEELGIALRARPDLAALDARHWVTGAEAKRRLAGVTWRTIRAKAPTLRIGVGPTARWYYVWLSPELEAAFVRRSLDETLAAARGRLGRAAEAPRDWVPRTEAMVLLRQRFGFPSTVTWIRAAASGALLEVTARPASGPGPDQNYVHMPRAVRDATDPNVAWDWLHGLYDPATPPGQRRYRRPPPCPRDARDGGVGG